jgi:hypothetical protein
MNDMKTDPRSAFNWNTTYVPQIDWSGFGRALKQREASSKHVERKAQEGINVGRIKGMGRQVNPASAYSRAKPSKQPKV